ncbi:MAG: hypothetical protein OIN66_09125 [Candidatus Methanoperedens sp.]|nr:hypothetical protein [Candidatus Methanoperedens sp.]
MKKIVAFLVVFLLFASPALADIRQKASLNGDNVMEINVDQRAWNYDAGDIRQDISVLVTGNYQEINQDNVVLVGGSPVSDPEYAGNISNTMNGLNIIRVDLNQYGNNSGSGILAQGINIQISDNMQKIDQDIIVLIGEE